MITTHSKTLTSSSLSVSPLRTRPLSPPRRESGGWAALRTVSPSRQVTRAPRYMGEPSRTIGDADFPALSDAETARDAPVSNATEVNMKAKTPASAVQGRGRAHSAMDWSSVCATERALNATDTTSDMGAVDTRDADAVHALRVPAMQLRTQARRLREKAAHARDRGEHARAERLNADAAALAAQAHTLQDHAAKRIFLAKNAERGVEQIDLHGLFAEEALERLETRLRLIAEKLSGALPTFELEVITGWGKGQSGRAILRPAVEAWLRTHAFRFVEKFPGHFFVLVRRNSFAHCPAADEELQCA